MTSLEAFSGKSTKLERVFIEDVTIFFLHISGPMK
jgi:hypothetical protein